MNALAASLFAVVFSIQGEIDEAASKGGEFLGTTPAKWLKNKGFLGSVPTGSNPARFGLRQRPSSRFSILSIL